MMAYNTQLTTARCGAPESDPRPAKPWSDRLAVAIVSYNTREHLRVCLEALQAQGARQVIVLDNASSDGSPEMVRTHFPGVVLRANATNFGYGSAANQAIRECGAEFVLLLNSDTRVLPGCGAALTRHFEQHRRAAVVGPRLLNPDGTLQPSCYPDPTPLNLLLQESGIAQALGHVPVLRERYLRTWRHDRPRIVPWVLGAALGIRRQAFEAVGGFDNSFYMYNEEVDLCFRLRRLGWHIHFAPAAEVVHVGGASTRQHRAAMRVQFFASTQQLYRRHYSRADRLLLVGLIKGVALARLGRDLLRLRRARPPDEQAGIREDVIAWRRLLGVSAGGHAPPR